jgi:hypothetical protein
MLPAGQTPDASFSPMSRPVTCRLAAWTEHGAAAPEFHQGYLDAAEARDGSATVVEREIVPLVIAIPSA